ncbi:MAG: N-acetylmuramoyl-L-alanine amidase [Saprospiraceae bacterium]|nr:N-acetylmuramoyl-L-alanine amidase [Saprospiraceae bacterium]
MLSKISIVSLFVLLSSVILIAEKEVHALAKVKKGENIEKLLKRYLLTPHTCNIDAFCDLNKIKSRKIIVAGKVYKLPLVIVTYNSKNIRSSVGVKDIEIARKIEKLNAQLLEVGIRDQNYKTSKKIWVPLVEFGCDNDNLDTKPEKYVESETTKEGNTVGEAKNEAKKTAPEPSSLNTATELKRKGIKEIRVPLMGPGYDIVNIEDFSLSGQVYYIISGHGGPDPGAMCTDCPAKMCEDEYAYDVALRLARDLMQHGATVHMIVQDENDGIRDEQFLDCDNDELLNGTHMIPLNQKKRLQDRAVTINRLYQKYKKQGVKVQKAIEIHVDSRSKDSRQDVFFYYNKHNKKSKKLAETVQEVFASKYDKHQKDRGYQGFVEDRGIYMVRNVLPTMLFVELANIRNTADQKRLLINTNRQALANWLFEGLRK